MTDTNLPAALREAHSDIMDRFETDLLLSTDEVAWAAMAAALRALGNTIMDPDEPVPTLDKVLWMISNWQNALDREATP